MTILALDVGSSSVRALLFENDESGVRLIPDAIVQKKYEFDSHEAGQATVAPEFLRGLLETCMDEILEHPMASSIEAVGMATFAGNWGLFDKKTQQAISPMITYADSRKAAFEMDFLPNPETRQHAIESTGAPLANAYLLPQFHKVSLSFKKVDLKRATIQDIASYCYRAWMQATPPMSYSIVSWLGMLNRQKLEWFEPFTQGLRQMGLGDYFLPLADYTQAQRGLSPEYAERWQALADVPFYLAVGDGAAAQVGSGAIDARTATLTIGTTAAIRKVSTAALPPVPAGCWSYRIDAAHHLLGGALSEGGNIFAWAKETLNLGDYDVEAELSKRAPDSHGLTVLPLLNGERSPNWRGDAVGTIHGLRLSTSPMDIVHALLEAVALRLATIAKQLELDARCRMIAAGGALHASPAWAQIICNALGREVYLLDEAEVTALGVAQLARCALRGEKVTGASPKIAKIYQANAEAYAIYQVAQVRQETLYRKIYQT